MKLAQFSALQCQQAVLLSFACAARRGKAWPSFDGPLIAACQDILMQDK